MSSWKFLSDADEAQLTHNSRAQDGGQDFYPVVKLFTPDANATWLLSELTPGTDHAFGLCDLGLGFPELGYVSLDELAGYWGRFGLAIARDEWFEPTMNVSDYAKEARKTQQITV